MTAYQDLLISESHLVADTDQGIHPNPIPVF